MSRRYCIDIDGTICSATTGRNYHEATPWKERIQVINKMYDRGDYIIYFTARGMGRFAGDPDAASKASDLLFDLTKDQLETWGCKYNELIMGKPHADYFIDDKAWPDMVFFNDKR